QLHVPTLVNMAPRRTQRNTKKSRSSAAGSSTSKTLKSSMSRQTRIEDFFRIVPRLPAPSAANMNERHQMAVRDSNPAPVVDGSGDNAALTRMARETRPPTDALSGAHDVEQCRSRTFEEIFSIEAFRQDWYSALCQADAFAPQCILRCLKNLTNQTKEL
ncbi:hypothetical protein BOX15_Mlig025441g1, partial [Macrostomum lignano]